MHSDRGWFFLYVWVSTSGAFESVGGGIESD